MKKQPKHPGKYLSLGDLIIATSGHATHKTEEAVTKLIQGCHGKRSHNHRGR